MLSLRLTRARSRPAPQWPPAAAAPATRQGRKAYPTQEVKHWPAKEARTSREAGEVPPTAVANTAVWKTGQSWYFDQQDWLDEVPHFPVQSPFPVKQRSPG